MRPLKIGVVVPHIFMHRDILPQVIFSPGSLAIDLVNALSGLGHDVTLFSPGPVDVLCRNIMADLGLFEHELAIRGDSYLDLLKKHPFTFVTLARQVQSEMIAKAFSMANSGEFDIIHIYTNEEDIALPFATLCRKPVVFTHHDPFNFLIKHKNIFPKYKHLNWISISHAQRRGMPPGTKWIGNVYHGVDEVKFTPAKTPSRDYFGYFGRIIEQKGVHLAIAAVNQYNKTAEVPVVFKIAGKHYAEHSKDTYWRERIEPYLSEYIQYVGFIGKDSDKRDFLGNARGLIVPSLFEEPFGMVAIEALACGTPVIALDSGALPEIIEQNKTGYVIRKRYSTLKTLDERAVIRAVADTFGAISDIKSSDCRAAFLGRFTTSEMAKQYLAVYQTAITQSPDQS